VIADRSRPILFRSGPLPWLEPGVVLGALVPLAAIAIAAARGTLGANPVAEGLNELGLLALIFLVASLACTPLKVISGATWPIRLRKTLGLVGFGYASLHLLTYVGLDQLLDLRALWKDVTERPFILVGMTAFVLLVPLAITSTARAVKRLGFARWKRLHRLAYLVGALGVVHFVLRVKKDVTEPAVYGAVLGALFAVRIGAWLKDRFSGASGRGARRAGASAPGAGG
jgi:sulfoxide reductase heme-binding subunit YedZ